MKKLLLGLSMSFCMLSTIAQDNNVKLNLLNVTYGDLRFGYERTLNENLSLQANIGVLIPRKLPVDVFDEESLEAEYGGGIDLSSKVGGTNFSFELRYYPGSKGAPRGFYLAPYFKHNHWKLEMGSVFEYDVTESQFQDLTPNQQATATPSNDPTRPYHLQAEGIFTGVFNQTGGGLMLGYQWLINDKISIDFNFFGLGVESDIVKLNLTTAGVDDIDYEEWGADIEDGAQEFADFGVDVEVDVQSDQIDIETSRFILPSPRFGLSVGYAF